MATEKEFKLIGSFQDNITSKLKKLNSEISAISKSFTKMQSKLRPIARDMGTIAMASERVAGALKSQRSAYDSNINAMKMYRSEMGKTVAAAKKLSSMKPPKAFPVPKGGGGGGGGRLSEREARGNGGVFGSVVAGGLVTSAIVKGFEIGTSMIQKTFGYVSQAFVNRIEDQLADIASAGGIFAGAKASGMKGFGSTMDDAMDVQKDLNRSMAKMAADLPGTTNDYVRNARSITDTIITAMSKQPQNFIKSMEAMSGRRNLDERGAMQVATGGIAKSTTLLEKLSPGGGMPMTMLFEDMMSREKVEAKSMQRKFASMRRNPTLIAALERNQAEINKTVAGSAERLAAINKALTEAVPPQMVAMMTRTVDGTKEAFKSAFLDPDTGFFGLSRQMKFAVRQFSSETGKVRLDKSGKEIREAVGIFEMIADIIGNFGVILANSVLPALDGILAPFDKLGLSLVDLREFSFQLYEKFQSYGKFFGEMAEGLKLDPQDFKVSMRAGLSVLTNVFESFGELKAGQYDKIMNKLMSKNVADVDAAGKELMDVFLGSKFMDMITGAVGKIAGGIISAIADAMDMLIGGSEKFASKGFGKGFAEAGGYSGLTRIFANSFKLLVKAFIEGVKLWFASLGENLKRLDLGAFIGQLGVTTALLFPILGGPIKLLLGNIFGALGAKIAAANIGGWIAGNLPVLTQSLSTLGSFVIPPIIGALKTTLATAAKFALSGAGLAAIAAVALAGLIYVFQEPIKKFIDQIQQWVNTNIGGAIAQMFGGITLNWKGLIDVVAGLVNGLIGIVTLDGNRVKAAGQQIMTGLVNMFNGLKQVGASLLPAAQQAMGMLTRAIVNALAELARRIAGAFGQSAPKPPNKPAPPKAKASFMGTGAETGLMSFGAALQAEQRGMPAGAKPIIANSSELIIPTENALNGNGSVADIIAPLQGIHQVLQFTFAANSTNFTNLTSASQQQVTAIQSVRAEAAATNSRLAALQAQQVQTNAKLTELKAKMNAPLGSFAGVGMAGGPGYGSKGSAIAGQLGNFIKATGGAPGSIHEHPQHGGVKYKHAPGSYHYAGRAIDIGAYANEQAGVLKRVAAFNAQYGVRPAELLHAGNDPNHQDHVHVAYARGLGMPRPFNSFMDALSYERHMMPAGTKAVYNTGETGGSSPTVNVTVNGGNGDPNAIANQVAAAVLNAIRQAESSTIA